MKSIKTPTRRPRQKTILPPKRPTLRRSGMTSSNQVTKAAYLNLESTIGMDNNQEKNWLDGLINFDDSPDTESEESEKSETEGLQPIFESDSENAPAVIQRVRFEDDSTGDGTVKEDTKVGVKPHSPRPGLATAIWGDVELVLDSIRRDDCLWYQVKWVDDDDLTWEPAEYLAGASLRVQCYHLLNPGKPGPFQTAVRHR
jgi:hypothetical protein